MKFAKDQVIPQIKKPLNREDIERGNYYESRLRIFTEFKEEKELDEEDAWKDIKKFMQNSITKQAEYRVSDFIIYPLSVCEITKGMLSDIYKVFNAGNAYFNIETVKKNGGEKLQKALEKTNIIRWIEEQGKKVLKNQPNTIVVVDRDENGDPYLIPLTNDRLIDFKLKDDNLTFEYVAFKHSEIKNEAGEKEERISFYDDETYYVLLKKGSADYVIETDAKHKIGYCPARMFLNERLNSNRGICRNAPLSLALSKLQEWQLFDIYKCYTDHYAPFPIVEMVREKCGVEGCDNGIIHSQDTYYDSGETKVRHIQTECKSCKDRNRIGVGAKILVDPQDDAGEPTASGKFRMINNDVSQLNYLKDKLKEIADNVKLRVVGADNVMTREAINEKQVEGGVETKENILLAIKTNLDELYEWIAITIARASIGDKPINVTANWGTEWYLISEDEIQERFKKAKEAGMPRAEIDMIYNQLIDTKYKGNPAKVIRLKIINKINPCPYDVLDDKIKKAEKGIISQKELIISEKLISFVERFEREQGSIVEFGEELEFNKKVEKILLIINNYADEYIKENGSSEPTGGSQETDE